MSLKLVNWNVQWATPRSRRSSDILTRIAEHFPEVICLTETHVALLPHQGHLICSQPDYGYPIKEGRRKVLLWSMKPWHQIDDVGIDSMPPGRFVSGVTRTSQGEVTIMGVCIPWAGSRVNRTATTRKRWEDHQEYLDGLSRVLDRTPAERLIVVGDFNQRLQQGKSTPHRIRSALQSAVASRLDITTSGLGFQGRRTIDHIALSPDLAAESLGIISNIWEAGKLSDHFGIVAALSAQSLR